MFTKGNEKNMHTMKMAYQIKTVLRSTQASATKRHFKNDSNMGNPPAHLTPLIGSEQRFCCCVFFFGFFSFLFLQCFDKTVSKPHRPAKKNTENRKENGRKEKVAREKKEKQQGK